MTSDHIKQIANIITEDPDLLLEVDERLRELERQSYTDQNAALKLIYELHRIDNELDVEDIMRIISYHTPLVSKLVEQAIQSVHNDVRALPNEESEEYWPHWKEHPWNFQQTIVGEKRVRYITDIINKMLKEQGEEMFTKTGYGDKEYREFKDWVNDLHRLEDDWKHTRNNDLNNILSSIYSIGNVVRFNKSQGPEGSPKSQQQLNRYLERFDARFNFTVEEVIQIITS